MSFELKPRQRRAIEALLTCRTQKEAAAVVGVSERQLTRWLADEEFRGAYREASRKRLNETVGRLRVAAADAVETLRAALSDEHTSNRIRAATVLLDAAVKAEVDDLAERLTVLEALAKSMQNYADRTSHPRA